MIFFLLLADCTQCSTVKSVQRYIKEDGFTLFSYILELSRFVNHLAANSMRMPRLMWMDEVGEELNLDGRLLSMPAFRAMFETLLEGTTKMLHDAVLLGMELPDLQHSVIHDILSDTTPGYSFLTDERNRFHLHCDFLISAMMDPSQTGTQFCYQAYSNASGVVWNMSGVREWLKTVETCLGNLFALLHYGSGQPARGTELSILCWINTIKHPRNFYWFGQHLNVVTLYNKTQSATGTQRLISRGLEPRVGQLYILWGSLVVPALVILAASIREPSVEEARRFHTLTFTSLTREWDADDLSSVLSSISGEPVANGGLGNPMGLADTRHFLIGIMRRHLHALVDSYRLTDELFNEQSGHSEEVGTLYALDYASIRNFPEERLHNFLRLSLLQHKLLARPSSLDTVQSAPLAPSSIISRTIEPGELKQFAVTMAAIMTPTIATMLAPRIQSNVADAFAAISPIGATPASASQALPVSTEAGMEIVDVDSVAIHPARYQELYKVMGKKALFRSKHQAAAVELTARGKHDLFVILGTGGGKSLVFMAAAANADETARGLITVVIVPLKALLRDLLDRLEEKNIRRAEWTLETQDGIGKSVRCVLVTVDSAASPSFMTFLRVKSAQKLLAHIVLDEVHSILTSEHYRPLFQYLAQLRQLSVPFVYLSATVPLLATAQLLEKLQILPGGTKLIRAPTVRPNLIYSRFSIDSSDSHKLAFFDTTGQRRNIVTYIFDFVRTLRQEDRVLVYCLSKKDAEDLAGRLKCSFYHADISEKGQETIYDRWKSNEGSSILTSTSCLSAGMDCQSVRMVVHWKSPRNLLDKEQESGRAGRDGAEAHAVVFWDPSDSGWRLAKGQNPIGIEEQKLWARSDQCLRIITGAFMDGHGDSCFQLGTVKLCGWCQTVSHGF